MALFAAPLLCGLSLVALTEPALALARTRHAAARPAAPQFAIPAKPNGTVILAVSLVDQRLTIWDDGVMVAQSPVSTGVPGHLTPRGIFSVLEKQKFHRSNLYSSAPMPFMQRITWSGVALHEGHVTGHPASHGCIRLPREVAIKLFGYTKMGARVIVTEQPIRPVEFSHPNLFAALPAAKSASADLPSPGAHQAQLAEQPASVTEALAPAPAEKLADTTAETPAVPPVAVVEAAPALPAGTAAPAEVAVETKDSAPVAEAPAVAAEATPAPAPVEAPAPVLAETPPATPAPAPVAAEAAPAPTPAPASVVAVLPKRNGHVAVFISAKEGKLFVRQGFDPVFESPITIAEKGKPLGTHLFTAMDVKTDDGAVRWTNVSVPDAPRLPPAPRLRKGETPPPPVALPAPSTAAEALDRISIPEEARLQVAQLINAGASLVISDQGFGSETTKKGTDFIVVTH